MSKVWFKSLLVSPVVLSATLLASAVAFAAPKTDSYELETATNAAVEAQTIQAETLAVPTKLAQVPGDNSGVSSDATLDQLNRYSREGSQVNSVDQVTNVSQFSDVRPGDWAYEALRNLVERYGCIAGYPNGTYRGNRAMTRYEFAAGLNACLRQVEKLIAAATTEFATKEDLETIRRLTQEFQAELATLGTRVDKLESRVGFLETHQFSTTTKLAGEAIFALSDTFGDDVDDNTVFGDRVRLDFQTSFTGRDKLHTRLTAGNLSAFEFRRGARNSNEGVQTFNLTDTNNQINLDWLAYEFQFGSSQVYLAATGGLFADFTPTLNPYFDNGDGGNGALSAFAQYSPIYRIGGGAGGGIRLGIGRAPILGPTSLTLGYLAKQANDPGINTGLLNGDYAALAQLNFTVSDRLALGATYVHGYHNTNPIFDIGIGDNVVGTSLVNGSGTPVVSNSYGIQAAFRLSNNISISGFGGTTFARGVGGTKFDSNVWYYGGGLALPDLGKKGNLAGVFVGVQPYMTGLRNVSGDFVGIPTDRSFHVEGFYKYQLNDFISITPGVIWLTAPNQNDDNGDAVIGTLRTTFNF